MLLQTLVVFAIGLLLGVVMGVSRRYLLRAPRLILRRLKILPRRTKILGRKAGTASLSAHPTLVGDMPAILRELHVIDDASPEERSFYDFSDMDRQLVAVKHGFKTFKQPKGLSLDAEDLDDSRHADMARMFFSSPIRIETDADNLYDEEEGAVIVKMFRRSDRGMLYAIDKFRRTVGDNARRIVKASVFAVLIWAVAAVLAQALIQLDVPAIDAKASSATIWLAALAVFALSMPSLWLWIRTNPYYSKARDTGFGDFAALLQGYFAGVSDKFVNAHAKMSQSILGEEDQDFLAEKAEKSARTMLWHAMRVLFIESFLRNEYYQMRRNLRFYQLLYKAGAAGGLLVAALLILWIGSPLGAGWLALIPWAMLAVSCVLAFSVWFASIGKNDTEHQISDLNWRGFEELHLDDRLREIIGAYAREAGIGKHRFSRGH